MNTIKNYEELDLIIELLKRENLYTPNQKQKRKIVICCNCKNQYIIKSKSIAFKCKKCNLLNYCK